MDNLTPSKPQKAPRKPLPPVSKPDTSGTSNKYQRKQKIGVPTIGVPPNKVTSVGLGKLTVETTTYGDTNVRPY